jgi:hypothetical protein
MGIGLGKRGRRWAVGLSGGGGCKRYMNTHVARLQDGTTCLTPFVERRDMDMGARWSGHPFCGTWR